MYTLEDRSIVFKNGLRHTFNDVIAEALPFDDIIVVRLENQGWKRINENIFGVNYKGLIVWQIPERIYSFAECPYVNIYRKNEMLDAYSWDGIIVTLNPRTGDPISESFVYSSTIRTPRKRQFI